MEDRSHTPHRLRTTLSPAQEAIVLTVRKTLGLSLVDLLAVVRKYSSDNHAYFPATHALKRYGASPRKTHEEQRPKVKPFKAMDLGFVHIDVVYLQQESYKILLRFLFVAIEHATRWVFAHIYASKHAANARCFLKALKKAAPSRVHTILTDNGKEFTDRFITQGERTPTGQHQIDQICVAPGIEHSRTCPGRPQTNGIVGSFSGRIVDILHTHHDQSGEELEATLLRYV